MIAPGIPLGRGRSLDPGQGPAIMGILNVTPDSFSDGGSLGDVESVVRRARALVDQGAVILDVGGESTRPGSKEIPVDEELRRVIPAVRALVAGVGAAVSVDTRKAAVFREAWAAGAGMLNDVSALAHDPEMAAALAPTDAAAILMHMRGTPRTMGGLCHYGDVVLDVISELDAALGRAQNAGVSRDRTLIDPGLGFAKTTAQSLELLRRIGELRRLGRPLVVGASRKRFLGEVTGRAQPADRDWATAAAVFHLARAGVEVVRVHEAGPAADAIRLAAALGSSGGGGG